MSYQELAVELLPKMQATYKAMHQKGMHERLQGEDLVLHYLGENYPNAVAPKEIGTAIGVSSARIATVLNSFESDGLVTREIDRSDRRKIIVKLTPEGLRIAEKNKQEFFKNTIWLLSLLGEQDAREYVRLMSRLADELSKSIL